MANFDYVRGSIPDYTGEELERLSAEISAELGREVATASPPTLIGRYPIALKRSGTNLLEIYLFKDGYLGWAVDETHKLNIHLLPSINQRNICKATIDDILIGAVNASRIKKVPQFVNPARLIANYGDLIDHILIDVKIH